MILRMLSLLLLVKLACRRTWRPALTVLCIGRKGQLTNVDKSKLQQNESVESKKLQHHKGPGARQDSLGAQQAQQPLFQTRTNDISAFAEQERPRTGYTLSQA